MDLLQTFDSSSEHQTQKNIAIIKNSLMSFDPPVENDSHGCIQSLVRRNVPSASIHLRYQSGHPTVRSMHMADSTLHQR